MERQSPNLWSASCIMPEDFQGCIEFKVHAFMPSKFGQTHAQALHGTWPASSHEHSCQAFHIIAALCSVESHMPRRITHASVLLEHWDVCSAPPQAVEWFNDGGDADWEPGQNRRLQVRHSLSRILLRIFVPTCTPQLACPCMCAPTHAGRGC